VGSQEFDAVDTSQDYSPGFYIVYVLSLHEVVGERQRYRISPYHVISMLGKNAKLAYLSFSDSDSWVSLLKSEALIELFAHVLCKRYPAEK
jgi:hypothetical protein